MKHLRLIAVALVLSVQIAEGIVLVFQQLAIEAAVEASKAQDRRIRDIAQACEMRPVSSHRPDGVDEARNE